MYFLLVSRDVWLQSLIRIEHCLIKQRYDDILDLLHNNSFLVAIMRIEYKVPEVFFPLFSLWNRLGRNQYHLTRK